MMKKQTGFFILVAILIGIGIGILIWNFLSPSKGQGVFYFQVKDNQAELFLLKAKDSAKKIASIPAREVDLGVYRVPRHSYFSQDKEQMIYFKKTGETPLEELSPDETTVVVRILSEPRLVNLKTKEEKKIDQLIDPASLVFSPNNKQIAWVKEVEESTHQELDKTGKEREVWLSRVDGRDAQLLSSFDENVVLLERWSGNYIYFQGIQGANARSLGRINAKTGEIEYIVPRYCNKSLNNCQNIEFSPSGRYFIYETYKKIEDREITELYLGDFKKREFFEVLTTDQISDRLWLNNEESFFYTEQEVLKKEGTRETIHLVNLRKETDDAIYTGSYISQLTTDSGNKYLYFLEKIEQANDVKLMRLNIKTRETEEILIDDYNRILLIQL